MFKVLPRQMQSLTAVVMLLFALAVCPVHAQEAILASDVTVDLTGKDANDARDKAMKKAEHEGLIQLLDKIAPDQREGVMSELDEKEISAMVKGIEVVDEKIAGNRYRALLRVSYNALTVNGLIETRVTAAATEDAPIRSTSVLVIPLFESGGKTMLWEPENNWKTSWNRVTLEKSGGIIVVPYGDDIDVKAVTASSAPTANYQALLPLFKRYGVGEIVIAKANYHESGVDVMRRHVDPHRTEVLMADYRPDPQEGEEALLLRAARDVADQILHQRDAMLERKAMQGEGESRVMIVIPFSRLASWTNVRTTLLGLQTIKRLDIVAMSPQQVDAVLQFRGTPEALAQDIQTAGLRVKQAGNYWVVSKE